VFYVIGIAVILGTAVVLWSALRHGRTSFWFFGFANSRAERPILYWIQIVGYTTCMAVIAYVVGTVMLAAISN
jgi:hypothetical protein